VLVYDRPARGDAFWLNVTELMPDWEHESRAVGGYWEARGTIRASKPLLHRLYDTWIGSLVQERTAGLTSWLGIVFELNLILNGVEHRRTLDSAVFRNEERVVYRYPQEEDSEQGTLEYSMDFTGAAHVTLKDDAQDFSDWETAAGDAAYKVEIENDDGSKSWGFLGARVVNTEIKVCEDLELTDDGFNGTERKEFDIVDVDQAVDWFKIRDPDQEASTDLAANDTIFVKESTGNDEEYTVSAVAHAAGVTQITVNEEIPDGTVDGDLEYWTVTPSTYKVIRLGYAGTQQKTAWATNEDSEDQFYTVQMLITEGEMPTWAAEALRDTDLERYGWPRSRATGGITVKGGEIEVGEDVLEVKCRGLWHALDWGVVEAAIYGTGHSVIEDILGDSDYLDADRLETNPLNCHFLCDVIPLTAREIVEKIIERGDDDGNAWKGGGYENGFVYEEQPTTVTHYLRNGRVVNAVGTPVIPSLLKPGFLLQISGAPSGGQPPGGEAHDDPRVMYVETVKFRAPDELELKLSSQRESVEMVQQMLQRRRGAQA